MTDAEKKLLTEGIFDILKRDGLKDSSMSAIARELRMSKRTLYEIYGSKEEMLRSILEDIMDEHCSRCQRTLESAPDTMHAMIEFHKIHQSTFLTVPLSFMKEANALFPGFMSIMREHAISSEEYWLSIYSRGCAEGVFREGLDFSALFRHLLIQMEAIKRMETDMPEGITFVSAFDNLWRAFLLSIASPVGIEVVEKYLPDNNDNSDR